MMKQKASLTERLNIDNEIRELKLGCTFNTKNATNTAFHTIKYDFKPASVDKSRVATVDVGSNNQVTVTVPNLVNSNSSVPHTIYKGNQKKYTKECILIYDKITGNITIERLNHNIQVKKTRDITNKPNVLGALAQTNGGALGTSGVGGGGAAVAVGMSLAPPPPCATNKLENITMRVTSKTKVSTGSRRNKIIELKGGVSNTINCPPVRNNINKNIEAAPLWNANNGQSTLPSIPMIVDDDDDVINLNSNNGGGVNVSTAGSTNGFPTNSVSISQQKLHNNSVHTVNSFGLHQYQQQQDQQLNNTCKEVQYNCNTNKQTNRKQQNKKQNQEQRPQSQSQSQSQSPERQQQNNRSATNNLICKNPSKPIPIETSVKRQNGSNNNTNQLVNNKQTAANMSNNSTPQDLSLSPTLAIEAAALEMNIVNDLSSSSSSSESLSSSSDSSDTDSDSDNDHTLNANGANNANGSSNNNLWKQQSTLQWQRQHQQQTLNQLPNLSLGLLNSPPSLPVTGPGSIEKPISFDNEKSPIIGNNCNYSSPEAFPNDLLQNDLQLSSNSSDDDDDNDITDYNKTLKTITPINNA